MSTEMPEKVRQQIEKGIEIIRKGGVVAYPTDTVFGLGAGIYHQSAIERIFRIKQRPSKMALPVLLAGIEQVPEVAINVPAYGWRLIERFLPGGLTLIVYRTPAVGDIITAGGDTVAIRIPDHPVPAALIRGSGMPIIGTSANLSGQPLMLDSNDVREKLGDAVDLVIDGVSPGGRASTVVDVTGEAAVILRTGAISKAEIEEVTEVKQT